MSDLVTSPCVSASQSVALPTTERLLSRAAAAQVHPLLHGMRCGTARTDQVAAWIQSRVHLAEYQARKDILSLAKLPDRDARRRWTPRLLAIDGHGDFYGPSRQGLLESWRRVRQQVCGPERPLSGALTAVLDQLIDMQLVRLQDASWIDSLASTLVDDLLARHDAAMALMLTSKAAHAANGWALQHNAGLEQHTPEEIAEQLGSSADDDLTMRALASIDQRVAMEHAILDAVQASASL